MKIVETIKTKLSLAVLAKDAFVPTEALKGSFSLQVNGRYGPVAQNRMGYWLFLDLPEGAYNVRAAGDYYSLKLVNAAGGLNPLRPVLEINLEPNASYPFPNGTTLLRGTVKDAGEALLADAKVSVDGEDRYVFTDGQGAFALYFKNVSGNQATVKLTISKEGFQTKKKNFNIQKGMTKVVSIILSTV